MYIGYTCRSKNWIRTLHTVYQSVTGNYAPTCINPMLQPVSGLDRQTLLRSASKGDFIVPRTRLNFGEQAFRVAAPCSGINFRPMSRRHPHWRNLKTSVKHFYFVNITALFWSSGHNNVTKSMMFSLYFDLLFSIALFYHTVCICAWNGRRLRYLSVSSYYYFLPSKLALFFQDNY